MNQQASWNRELSGRKWIVINQITALQIGCACVVRVLCSTNEWMVIRQFMQHQLSQHSSTRIFCRFVHRNSSGINRLIGLISDKWDKKKRVFSYATVQLINYARFHWRYLFIIIFAVSFTEAILAVQQIDSVNSYRLIVSMYDWVSNLLHEHTNEPTQRQQQ